MKKVLLAFSGGLDTSYCARYLAVDLGMEVHSVIVNTGGFTTDELATITSRAASCSVVSHAEIDRTQELYDKVLRHCIAGNVLKNHSYPLSVSAERIIQAIAIAERAREIGADAIAHGSTGAGNDQVRFDLIFRTICPDLDIITPIRDMSLSREQEIAYLRTHGVEGDWTRAEYSINQGIWGTTIGGRETLTSDKPLPEHAFPSSSVPAASKGAVVSLSFDRGQPVAIDGKVMDPVDVLAELNALGSTHRVGRGMHVGDTIIGIKGRVAFEAPAAHIVIEAHRQLEKHTLSKWQINLKDQLSLWYGQLLHEGQFLDPAMRSMEAFFDETQRMVTGKVDVRLELGRIAVEGIRSPFDLMNADFASYGEDHAAWSPADARGFAAIAAIATRLHKERSS